MPFDGIGFVVGESLEKLDRVADLIGTPTRWCKGSFRTSDGRFCLRGALMAVHARRVLEDPVLAAINQVTGRAYRRIEFFNDDSDTDHQLICRVLAQTRANILSGKVAAPPPAMSAPVAPQTRWHRCQGAVKGWLGL